MIKSCGIDIVELKRLGKSLKKPGFIDRVFTQEEIKYCTSKRNSNAHFGARWAAKEAFIKATKNKAIRYKDIWIKNSTNGNPQLCISKRAQKLAGLKRTVVSMSHSNNYALAVVVIE